MSHSDSKGADRLEILVEGDSIHDKYNEERGQKLPNEGHSRLRVGQRANCDESRGGGRQGRGMNRSGNILSNKHGIGGGSSGGISSRYIVVNSSSIHRVVENSIVVGAY